MRLLCKGSHKSGAQAVKMKVDQHQQQHWQFAIHHCCSPKITRYQCRGWHRNGPQGVRMKEAQHPKIQTLILVWPILRTTRHWWKSWQRNRPLAVRKTMVHQHQQQAIHLHGHYWPPEGPCTAAQKQPSLLNNGGPGVSQMRVAQHQYILTWGWFNPWPMSGPLGTRRIICPPTCSLRKGRWAVMLRMLDQHWHSCPPN